MVDAELVADTEHGGYANDLHILLTAMLDSMARGSLLADAAMSTEMRGLRLMATLSCGGCAATLEYEVSCDWADSETTLSTIMSSVTQRAYVADWQIGVSDMPGCHALIQRETLCPDCQGQKT